MTRHEVLSHEQPHNRAELTKDPDRAVMWRVGAVEPLTRITGSPFSPQVQRPDDIWTCVTLLFIEITLPSQDVWRAIGVLQTNTVALAAPGQRSGLYSALYPTFSLLSHSCRANARFTITRGRGVEVTAQVEIQPGEEVTIQYLTPLLGNTPRQQRIARNWLVSSTTNEHLIMYCLSRYFECCCERCIDPSELGTGVSDLVCGSCGGVQRAGPPGAGWRCQDCGAGATLAEVEAGLAGREAELEQCGGGAEQLQQLLTAWLASLPPTHYLTLLLKRRLLAALKVSYCM